MTLPHPTFLLIMVRVLPPKRQAIMTEISQVTAKDSYRIFCCDKTQLVELSFKFIRDTSMS
uniref:Uncharacterized protein n=1 Tax=Anguilla anguilla TaxID=7936 RepID=A0A0E9PZR2_ANGAN